MEPELPESYIGRATLADLLDRVLDRGLFLRADLVISVAGIPLIGVSLNAVVAGIETLLEYGIMSDWDTASRTLADYGVVNTGCGNTVNAECGMVNAECEMVNA